MNSRSLLTGLVLLVLFFTLINNFKFSGTSAMEISYSDFLQSLDRGQVASVTISGDIIHGTMSSGKNFKTITPK